MIVGSEDFVLMAQGQGVGFMVEHAQCRVCVAVRAAAILGRRILGMLTAVVRAEAGGDVARRAKGARGLANARGCGVGRSILGARDRSGQEGECSLGVGGFSLGAASNRLCHGRRQEGYDALRARCLALGSAGIIEISRTDCANHGMARVADVERRRAALWL